MLLTTNVNYVRGVLFGVSVISRVLSFCAQDIPWTERLPAVHVVVAVNVICEGTVSSNLNYSIIGLKFSTVNS